VIAEKERKRRAKHRLDWKRNERVFVNHGGKWQEVVVVENVPRVGVRVRLGSGGVVMVNATKIKEENPQQKK
jgi:hypothetical protein